jgi:hypothetical protein
VRSRGRVLHHPGSRTDQPQELQGLGVDDVEAAASVHEDLGEPNIADDRVDDERVPSWARHIVGVVTLVEGNGLVGLV